MHAVSVAPSTAIPQRPLLVRAEPYETPALDHAALAAAELNRWLLFLTVPFVVSAACFMTLIGTGQLWLIGASLITGPGLLILAFIHLAISSDTNGAER